MIDSSTFDRPKYLDLAQLLRDLRERKWFVVGVAFVALGMSVTMSISSTHQYKATAQVLLQTTSVDEGLFGVGVFQVPDTQRALTTAADLVALDDIARMVKQDLSTFRSAHSLQEMLSVTSVWGTNLVTVTAISPSASEAAAVANSFARQFILFRQELDRKAIRTAETAVQARLDSMMPADRTSEAGLKLKQAASELAILESTQTGGLELVQSATVPRTAFAPRVYGNAAVALALGLVIGMSAAFLLQSLDGRIKDEEAVQRELGAPVIAGTPSARHRWFSGRAAKRSAASVGFSDPASSALEAYRALWSNLKFFDVDRKLKTLLVTSPSPRTGKTRTAINLALTLAIQGSRVILVEANLRTPALQHYLDLDDTAGFSNLLTGTRSIEQVAQFVDVGSFLPQHTTPGDARADEGSAPRGNLMCIPAGPLPPNPAEFLAMEKTSEVLRLLASLCDYLVILAPPLLSVSDAVEMARRADGVVLVVRLFSTRIQEARKARETLRRVGIAPLGVIVLRRGDKGAPSPL